MTNGQFFYTLAVNSLLSLAISIGVTDYMLNQRDEAKEVVAEEHISPEIKAMAESNKLLSEHKIMLAEADLVLKQVKLDETLSKDSGVEVVDAYKMEDSIEAKLQIEEGKRFCRAVNGSLVKIKFYETASPYIKCNNGVTDK